MEMVVGILMSLNTEGKLEFLTANEKQNSLLFRLLRRTQQDGRGIKTNDIRITVDEGRFLYTRIRGGEKHVYFPYMIGKGFYGLYIVDEGFGDLVFMTMGQVSTHAQDDELKLLEELGKA